MEKPIIKKIRWPVYLAWAAPVFAAIVAGYFFYERAEDRGPVVTVQFKDATGLKPGESKVVHLGVQIGEVESAVLGPDKTRVMVKLRLHRSDSDFAKQGARFWIVRPEVSTQEISGLATVISGPYIDALPGGGGGEAQSEFTGLEKAPRPKPDGVNIVLTTLHPERLAADSPVYYHDIQVGFVQGVELSPDASTVNIHALVLRRYAALVRTNSEFWAISAVDFKGSIFTGLQVKVESLRSLISGGVGLATPEEKMGEQAADGDTFTLHDEPKKDWLTWAPRIAIEPGENGDQTSRPGASDAAKAIGPAVGTK